MRTGRQLPVDLRVERDEADGILLLLEQERERRGRGRPVVELAPGGRRLLAVPHRLAAIEQQVTLEIGLFLVLLDVQPVGLRPDAPVDVLEFVPRHILAVSGELDGKAVVRAFVLAGEETLHDQPRPHVEPRNAFDGLCVKIFRSLDGHL